MADVMSYPEVHDFGVEIVENQLRREGAEILQSNRQLGRDPQIIARKNGLLLYVLVRTAIYPGMGLAPSTRETFLLSQDAAGAGALLQFASVGIANADGKTDEEKAVPLHGAGYHASYKGLEPL